MFSLLYTCLDFYQNHVFHKPLCMRSTIFLPVVTLHQPPKNKNPLRTNQPELWKTTLKYKNLFSLTSKILVSYMRVFTVLQFSPSIKLSPCSRKTMTKSAWHFCTYASYCHCSKFCGMCFLLASLKALLVGKCQFSYCCLDTTVYNLPCLDIRFGQIIEIVSNAVNAFFYHYPPFISRPKLFIRAILF